MSYLFHDELANANQVDTLAYQPEPVPPGLFTGTGGALAKGPKHVLDLGAQALADTATPMLAEATRPLDAYFGSNFTQMLEDERLHAREITRRTRVDPTTTGVVGQAAFGLSKIVTEALVAGVATGGNPFAIPAAIGTVEGYDEYLLQRDQGVDPVTALELAGVTGLTMGLGAALPFSLGLKTLGDIGWNVGVNVGLGAAQRETYSAILKDAGYGKMAEHYKALDGVAIALDASLGAAFPIASKFVDVVGSMKSARDYEAALRSLIRRERAAGGMHTTPESRKAQFEAEARVEEQILSGKLPGEIRADIEPGSIEMVVPRQEMETKMQMRADIEARVAEDVPIAAARQALEQSTAKPEVRVESVARAIDAVPPTFPEFPKPIEPAPVAKAAPVGKEPAKAEPPKDAATPEQAAEPGRPIPEPVVERIWKEVRGTKEVGATPYHQVGRALVKQGAIRTLDDFKRLVNDLKGIRDKGLAGEKYQAAVREVAAKYAPSEFRTPDPMRINDPDVIANQGDIATVDEIALRQLMDENPDLDVAIDARGLGDDMQLETRPLREVIAELDNDIANAEKMGKLHAVAVACAAVHGE